MGMKPFANAEPFLQLIILFLISFFSAGVFILGGQGLIAALWGVNLMESPEVLRNFDNAQTVHINRVLLLFQHIGLFIVPAWVFSKLSSHRWRPYVGFRPVLPPFVWGSALIMILSLPAINAMAWLNQQLVLPEFLRGVEAVFQNLEESAAELTTAITKTDNVWELLANIFVIALIPAIGEEMIFRGLVLPILRRWTRSVHWAVWISALLFSMMHLQFYGFVPRLVLGALLGYLFVWSRTLWAPIIAHFTNNALALIVIFFITRGGIDEELDSFDPTGIDWVWLVGSVAAAIWLIRYLLKFAPGWKRNDRAERLRHDVPDDSPLDSDSR